MGLFDVHAHLTHPRLAARSAEVLERARLAGVTTIISNGLHPEDNAAVAALAASAPAVLPAFGLYPVHAVLREMTDAGVEYPDEPADWTAEEAVGWVREHAGDAIAVGEIGLDGYWVPEAFWERQEQVFRQLLRVARDLDKPVILHSRKRERRCLEILQEEGVTRADWHCFGSKVKLARQIAAAGYHLSIPANARRSEAFTRMLESLPRDKVLLETDCPYLSPERGTDNEPAHVAGTAAFAAELWGEPMDAVQRQLEDNFEALFGVAP
jgi:TatD DNase family protein